MMILLENRLNVYHLHKELVANYDGNNNVRLQLLLKYVPNPASSKEYA
ncbi:hypothetical protein NXX38_16995 [Bacteroides sp. BFG-637]|nr:hypothetical protein [Bacteroides sp. BFG-637]MCS3313497.1 hypothetical protein [Bacteroides sp. BFG-637]